MIDFKLACKEWYLRQDVAWEILKDVRSHSSDFKGRDLAINRFYKLGDYGFLLGQLRERFVNGEDPFWHFYRSIALIRFTKVEFGKVVAADVNEDFDQLIYGFDIPVDFDNVKYKAWLNERVNAWRCGVLADRLRDVDAAEFFASKKDVVKISGLNWLDEVKVSTDFFNHKKEILSRLDAGRADYPSVDECREVCDRTIDEPFKAAKRFSEVLDGVPYVFQASGTGFHVKIEWDDLKPFFQASSFGKVNKALAQFLISKAFGRRVPKTISELIDMSTIGEGKGLIRASYSLHPNVARVCLPLSRQQVEEFTPELTNYERVLEGFAPPRRAAPFNHRRPGSLAGLMAEFAKSGESKKVVEAGREVSAQREKLKALFEELPERERKDLMAELQAGENRG